MNNTQFLHQQWYPKVDLLGIGGRSAHTFDAGSSIVRMRGSVGKNNSNGSPEGPETAFSNGSTQDKGFSTLD